MRRAGIAETSIGIFILVLLAGVAGGIYIVQSRFDPDLFTQTAQTDSAGRKNSLPSPSSAPVPAFLPEDLIPLGPEETFDSETLSDKIDGKAELYLSSGFVKLSTRRFALKTDPKSWMELYIYEMGNPTNAFSVYSVQKRQDSKPLELGVSAYATADALFFADGPKYFEILSASKDLAEDMTALARNLVEAEPKPVVKQTESSLFPAESLDESSISLHLSDVFGFSGLDRVYTAGDDRDPPGSRHSFHSEKTPRKPPTWRRHTAGSCSTTEARISARSPMRPILKYTRYSIRMKSLCTGVSSLPGLTRPMTWKAQWKWHRGFTANWERPGNE